MDNRQKLQMLQTKFINNNVSTTNKLINSNIIKEKFVGGGYKTFLETDKKNNDNNIDNIEQFTQKKPCINPSKK